MKKVYDVVIVGGGIAGLTAAAYNSIAGLSTLVLEKESNCGGLVNNFEREGIVYDGGVRAIENSGVLLPMLKQLGISLELVTNKISVGVEDNIIFVNSENIIEEYEQQLKHLYPDSADDIDQIILQIRKIMHYMDVQYGIDNPLFLDMKKDREYLMKKIFPWIFKYAITAPKISKINIPVLDFLRKFTQNQSLLDIITQHFFQETPAFFALSYLKLYMDYYYPLGGTSKLIVKLIELINEQQGQIKTGTKIIELDLFDKYVKDTEGNTYYFKRLIWAADQVTLYKIINPTNVSAANVSNSIIEKQNLLIGKSGNDSVYTVFLGVNLDSSYFSSICSEHFFYTPKRTGQSIAGPFPINQDRKTIKNWLQKFFQLTTFEISIPVLRDRSMAPEGKTGLIISVLFDYKFTKFVEEQGWYEDFKEYCENCIIDVLNESVFSDIKKSVLHIFSSSPLTLAKLTGNHEGAITGWSFTNRPVPAEGRLPKILKAIKTPIPGIYQAGHWTYSPSGLPIAILTGKIAADQVIKDLRK